MQSRQKKQTRFYSLIALCGLVLLFSWPTLVAALPPLTPALGLEDAWRKASDNGVYHYQTDLAQTTHPTEKLVNVGRSPKKKVLHLSGKMDRPNETMRLSLSQANRAQPLELKVEKGVAYGWDAPSEQWVLADENQRDLFTLGEDPLAFLNAATNIQQAQTINRADLGLEGALLAEGETLTPYTFQIDGPHYAAYMRDQLEAELHRKGELPAGITLGTAKIYKEMTGQGEVWLNEAGLPVRQTLHLNFAPEQDARNWYSADITTNYHQWGEQTSLGSQVFGLFERTRTNPAHLLNEGQALLHSDDLQTGVMVLSFMALFVGLAALSVIYRRSPKLYNTFATAVIFTMLVTPLLQSQQVFAYSQQQSERQAEQTQKTERDENLARLKAEWTGKDFNPLQNPLAGGIDTANTLNEPDQITSASPDQATINNETSASAAVAATSSSVEVDCETDTDNDGLDDVEISDTNDADSDGLSDNVECYKIGTWTDIADTDGDRISDGTEVAGVTVENDSSGTIWYLDPLTPDSNGDGLDDLIECPDLEDTDGDGAMLTDGSGLVTGPISTECDDTDGDGTPDLFDYDNDGDGVPDSVDSSPYYRGNLTQKTQDQFNLSLSGYDNTTERVILVDFELRPTIYEHLYQSYNVLDWPDNDTEGQVTRVFTTTWQDEGYNDTKTDNGDLMLVPMLEIEIPAPDSNTTNPAGGLPVLEGVNASTITNDTDLSAWLDTDTLDEYSIEVSQDDETGTLYVYLPLYQLQDETGETPVAWSGQMYYKPETGLLWGQNHQVRMIWLVNALVDECDTTNIGNEDYDIWCSANNEDHWTTSTSIIQTYYEDFYLTGLKVKEDYGFDVAIIAQNNALDAGVNYEAELWYLSYVLAATFGEGMLLSGGNRFDIPEIENRFGANSPYSSNNNDPELWGLDNTNFTVEAETGYADQITGLTAMLNTHLPHILTTTYASATADDIVTLLFVFFETYRTTTLDNDSSVSTSGSSNITLAINLNGLGQQTYATLNWVPYQYDGADWDSYDYVTYLDDEDDDPNQLGDQLQAALSNTEIQNWFDDLGEDYDDLATAKGGIIGTAKNYYLALYLSETTIVEDSDWGYMNDETIDDTDFSYGDYNPLLIISLSSIASLQYAALATGDTMLDGVYEILEVWNTIEDLWDVSDVDTENIIITVVQQTGTALQSFAKWKGKKIYKSRTGIRAKGLEIFTLELWGFEKGIKYTHFSATAGIIAAGLTIASLFTDGTTNDILEYAALSTFIVSTLFDVADKVRDWLVYTNRFGDDAFRALYGTVDNIYAIKKVTRFSAQVGFALDVSIAAAIFIISVVSNNISIDSLAFTALVADFMAQVITAIVVAFISATVVGALIIAVIALIDAVIALICKAVGVKQGSAVDTWVCGGIMGAFTEAITYVIYDQTPLANLSKKSRLDFSVTGVALKNEDDGFIVGNALQISGVVTAALYYEEPDTLGWAYYWQFDADNLEESAFAYKIQTSKSNLSVSKGDTTWTDKGSGDASAFSIPSRKQFETTLDFAGDYATFSTAGINQSFDDLYFSEAFEMNAQECWMMYWGIAFYPVCYLRDYDDINHNDISEDFVFDVFPKSFESFIALSEVENNSYRLAWDNSFPTLRDADGDGLPSVSHGGSDPDDLNPDYDGDGLSDYWEVENGFDPTTIDYDCDGLTDYWEAFYGTEPYQADTDSDGLPDGLEVYHPTQVYPYKNNPLTSNTNRNTCQNDTQADWIGGWEIVYDYDSTNTPINTHITANPLSSDTDGDNITDRYEYIYGYNPNVENELNVLTLESEVNDTLVAPGGTIPFTATIKNELDNRYASGLLQAEFPVDTVQVTEVIDTLAPLDEVTMIDTVDVDTNISTSQVSSLTVRAGALIENLSSNYTLLANFNEAAGSTFFADDSGNGYDGVCFTDCPTANGSYLTLDGVDDAINFGSPPQDDSFSVGLWVNPATANQDAYLVYTTIANAYEIYLDNGLVTVTGKDSSDTLQASTALAVGEWSHVMVTYSSAEMVLYINGIEMDSLDNPESLSRVGVLLLSFSSGSFDNFAGSIDQFVIYDYPLRIEEVENLIKTPILEIDMSGVTSFDDSSNWDNSVTSGGLVTPYSDGAGFDQLGYMDVSGESLDLTDSDFSFAMWIKPQTRFYPFDTDANAAFWIKDTTYDWQGVFGSESIGPIFPYYSSLEVDYPSLYISDEGHLRLRFKRLDASSLYCTFETENPVVTYSQWQYLALTYDGNTLTFYLNGEAIDATTVNDDCPANTAPASTASFSIGRPNEITYLFYDYLNVDDARNSDFDFRLKFDEGPTVEKDNVKAGNYNLNWGLAINDLNSHTVSAGVVGRGYLASKTVSWATLSSQTSLWFDSHTSSSDSDAGTVYWSVSNDYFRGVLDDFQLYRYALDAETIARLYDGTRHLLLEFDEPPGQDTFSDDSGNDFEAVCDSTNDTCPDSGIPGRSNQALRFDGDQGQYAVVNIADLDELSDFTAGVWFKLTGNKSNNRTLIHQADGGRLWLGVDTDDTLYTYIQGQTVKISTVTLNEDQWYYAALTVQNNKVTLGLHDGNQFYTISNTDTPDVSDGNLYLGVLSNLNSSRFYTGLLDHLTITRIGYSSTSDFETAVEGLMKEVPVFNLHLDEDLETTTFADDTPYANNATCSGPACPSAGDKGQMREALLFDGEDDLLTIPHNSNYDFSTFSVGLWVKPTQTKNNYQPLIAKQTYDDSNRTFGLFIYPGSMTPFFSIHKSSCNTGVPQTANGSLSLNQWNHLMMTFDGQKTRLYINGQLDSNTGSYTGTPCQNSEPIYIGNGGGSNKAPFAGNIDEVALYTTVLSDDEIADLYDYQSAWYDTTNQHAITVDADDPVVTVGISATHLSVTADTIFAISAYDLTSSVAQVEYRVNGGTWSNATLDSLAWIATFSPTGEGVYTLEARATDAVGNTATDSVTFTVDNTPSAVTLDSYLTSGVQTSQDGSITLSGRLSDSSSGVEQATLSVALYDEDGGEVSGYESATIANGNWTIDYPLPNDHYGLYTLQAIATDDVGNSTGVTNLASIALDTVGPVGDSTLLSAVLVDTTVTGTVDDAIYPLANRVVHYHFEEGANATEFADSSGNVHTATCTVCPTAGQTGQVGLGLTFDGTDDFISITHDDTMNIEADDDFSLSLWVNPGATQVDTAASTNTLIEKWGGSGGYPFSLSYLNQSGGVRATRSDGSTTVTLDSTQTINDGQFHHLALVKADETLYLYIDGELNQTATDVTTNTITNTASLYVGMSGLNASYFTGDIDELLLYNTALTTETIASLNNPPEASTYDTTDLVVQYRFEENTLTNGVLNQVSDMYAANCSGSACPTLSQTGQQGDAFSFDGNDVLTIDEGTTPFDFDNNSLTVMAWINHNNSGDYKNIVSHKDGGGATTGWTLRLNNDNVAAFFVGNGTSRWDALSPALAPNTWYHLAGVLDRNEGTVKLYVDGTLIDSQPNFSGTVDSSVNPMVGSWDVNSNFDYFKGLIDEVMIYKRALSTTEIEAIAKATGPTVTDAKIRYRHASGAVWPGLTPDDVVFYAPLDTANFTDLSLNNHAITCTTKCPVAEQEGVHSYAASFDGSNDRLDLDNLFDPGNTPFTLAAWFNITNYNKNRYILQQADGTGSGRSLLYIRDNGYLSTFLGGSRLSGNTLINPDQWYHAAVTYDGTTLKLYLNGNEENSDVRTMEASDGTMLIGADKNKTTFFKGLIDEVVVFNRALSTDEINLIADTNPWSSVTLDSPESQFTTWNQAVPTDLADGVYKLDLWTTDSLSNSRTIPNIWMGEIDTLAPTLAFTITDLGGGLYEVTCEATDFNLSETGWNCPVNTSPTPTYLQDVADYEWYTQLFTNTDQLVKLSAGPEVISSSLISNFTACDIYGHCATSYTLPFALNDSLSLWLKADEGTDTTTPGNPVSSWEDQSDTGNTATQSTSGSQATYQSNQLNGYPALKFDGDDGLDLTAGLLPSGTSARTYIIVTKPDAAANMQTTFSQRPSSGDACGQRVSLTTVETETSVAVSCHRYGVSSGSANWQIVTFDLPASANSGQWDFYRNGSQLTNEETFAGSSETVNTATGEALLGNNYAGTIAEFIVYDIELSDSDRALVEAYLADKYALTISSTLQTKRAATTGATAWASPREATRISTVSLRPPAPFNLTVTTDGQALSDHQTVDWLSNPLLTATWPDDDNVVSYYVEWLAQSGLGTTVLPSEVVVQSETITTGPTTSSYQASEGQIISLRVTATDGGGNTQQEQFGPVYSDEALTPVLVAQGSPPYRGWLETSCNLIGLDNRRAQQVSNGSIFNKPQQFYTSWNENYLRLAWEGADWTQQGDLFIYLDTGAGGSTTAYNPFGSTVSIFLPTDLSTNTQLGADYLIWVRETPISQTQVITDDDTGQPVVVTNTIQAGAILLAWDEGSSTWNEISGGVDYQLDTNRVSPLTDLSIPFAALGINDPANQPLNLVAFATEEDALEMWASMPAANNLNSGQVIGANGEDAVEAFTLLRAYRWATLGSGQCPSGTLLSANGQRRALTDPVLFNGATLAAGLSADPSGVSYNLFDDNLIFAHNKLFSQAVDWDAVDDDLCAEWEAENPSTPGDNIPAPAACSQVKTDGGELNPHWVLPRLLNTDHPDVVNGQELNYTVRVINNGDSPSYNVTVKAFASGPLRLLAGTVVNNPPPPHYVYQQVIPVLEANQVATVTFQGVVDFNLVPPEDPKEWARLKVRIFDETGNEFSPNEELHLDHQIDKSGPDYMEWQTPAMLLGNGETLVRGVVHDESAVPTLILEVAGQQTTCPDPTPTDHQWACLITLANLTDGTTITPQMKAIDEHGFESDWFLATPLTVDTIAPTLTVITDTLADGLIGPFETTLQGELSDNRYAHEVVVCDGDDCESAIVNLDPASLPQTTYIYEDVPADPIAVGTANTCPNEFLRTIAVTDTFVIADLDVGLNLAHDNRNDVVIFLTSPAGTRAEIISRGGSQPNLDVRLDDAALRSIYADDDQSEHNIAPPYYQQARRPYSQQLDRFRGEQAEGTWTFNICDSFPDNDEGWYNHSQLIFRAETTYSGSNATWTYDLLLPPNVENLTKTLAIYGVDEVGNSSPAQTFAVVVDTQGPRLTLTGMDGFVNPIGLRAQTESLGMVLSNQPFTLTGNISDTNETFMNLTVLNENARYARNTIDDQGAAWVYERTTPFNRLGVYKVWIEGNDRLGNTTNLGPYQIQAIAAPRLVKSLQTPTTITVGSVVTYTITLYNDNSAVDFVSVVISDPLTSTLQPIAGGDMVIDSTNNVVSWPAFDLLAGESISLTFQAVVTATTLGTQTLSIPNQAYVTVSGLPQVSSNEVTFDLGQLPSPSGGGDGRIYLPLLMK